MPSTMWAEFLEQDQGKTVKSWKVKMDTAMHRAADEATQFEDEDEEAVTRKDWMQVCNFFPEFKDDEDLQKEWTPLL